MDKNCQVKNRQQNMKESHKGRESFIKVLRNKREVSASFRGVKGGEKIGYIKVSKEDAILLEKGCKDTMDRVYNRYIQRNDRSPMKQMGKYYKPFFPF